MGLISELVSAGVMFAMCMFVYKMFRSGLIIEHRKCLIETAKTNYFEEKLNKFLYKTEKEEKEEFKNFEEQAEEKFDKEAKEELNKKDN